MKNLILIFSVLAAICLSSCKKDKEIIDNNEDPPELILIQEETSLLPMQISRLYIRNATFADSIYNATISTTTVQLYKINDTTVVFIMPVLPSGSATMSFSINNTSKSLVFNILAQASIPDHKAYILNYLSSVDDSVNANLNLFLSDTISNNSNIEEVADYYIQKFSVEVQQLDSSELELLAYIIQANLSLGKSAKKINKDYEIIEDELRSSKENLKLYMTCLKSQSDVMKELLNYPFKNLLIIFKIPNYIEYWLKTYYYLKKCETIRAIPKPNFDLVSTYKSRSLQFINNEYSEFNLKTAYRNVNAVDVGSSEPGLNAINQNSINFKDNSVEANSSFLNEKQVTVPGVLASVSEVIANGKSIHSNYISVSSASSNVQLASLVKTDYLIKIKFSTTQTIDQNFSFNIVYQNPGFATISKQFTATLKTSPPYSIAKVSGDNQSGLLGYALTNPIKVIIKDQQNNPYEGATVFFTANNGGSVSQSQVITNASGQASVNWTLGSAGSTQTLTVKSYKSDGTTHLQGSPLTFSATVSWPAIYMIGNYEAVQIGSQVWMAKNLNITTANSWCFDNNSANCATYGRLYTWSAALTACPSGWHLPSDAEWTTLTNFLGGESVAAGKLKETGTTHWYTPNSGATNETCFTALPGGYRTENEEFINAIYYGRWWTSTVFVDDANYAHFRWMHFNGSNVLSSFENNDSGHSVRCVKN